MDKEYMLLSLRRRRRVLESRYTKACSLRDEQDNDISEGCAAAIRTQCKRDLQLLSLIEQLLIGCQSIYIEDDDAIDGFHKLIEPVERFRRNK